MDEVVFDFVDRFAGLLFMFLHKGPVRVLLAIYWFIYYSRSVVCIHEQALHGRVCVGLT